MMKLATPQMPRMTTAPGSVVVVNGSANEVTISTARPTTIGRVTPKRSAACPPTQLPATSPAP